MSCCTFLQGPAPMLQEAKSHPPAFQALRRRCHYQPDTPYRHQDLLLTRPARPPIIPHMFLSGQAPPPSFSSSGTPTLSFLGFCLLTDPPASHLPRFPILPAAAAGGPASCFHLQCSPVALQSFPPSGPGVLATGPASSPFPPVSSAKGALGVTSPASPRGAHQRLSPARTTLPSSPHRSPRQPLLTVQSRSLSPPPGNLSRPHPAQITDSSGHRITGP